MAALGLGQYGQKFSNNKIDADVLAAESPATLANHQPRAFLNSAVLCAKFTAESSNGRESLPCSFGVLISYRGGSDFK